MLDDVRWLDVVVGCVLDWNRNRLLEWIEIRNYSNSKFQMKDAEFDDISFLCPDLQLFYLFWGCYRLE